jgi:dTMP kinase
MDTSIESCFLVIEAVDLAGKSTQLSALAEALRSAGLTVATTAYPERAAPLTGALIEKARYGQLPLVPDLESPDESIRARAARRQMLLAQVLFSLNRREQADHLESLMARHQVVVSSRYSLSGLVYAEASGVARADIEALLGGLEFDLRHPDLTLVLDVDPNVVAQRPRAEELDAFERNRAMQLELRRIYRRIADTDPRVVLVDGTGDQATVSANLIAAVRANCPELFGSPITRRQALANSRDTYQALHAYASARMAIWAAAEQTLEQAARLSHFQGRLLARGAATMAALTGDESTLDPIGSAALEEYRSMIARGIKHAWDDDEAIGFWVTEFPRLVGEILDRKAPRSLSADQT